MLNDKDRRRLERIVTIVEQIDECIARNKISRSDILLNRDTQWLLSMPLTDIAEQVYKLSDEFKDSNEDAPWRAIESMRHRLVHGYESIAYEFVADAVFEEIHGLRSACIKATAE